MSIKKTLVYSRNSGYSIRLFDSIKQSIKYEPAKVYIIAYDLPGKFLVKVKSKNHNLMGNLIDIHDLIDNKILNEKNYI